ncbi:hypothetical protein NPIL_153761 [Nephila pilipes]|uniref:Uncharacterized protein n=1 Tax=Nephila pilipes TaxID=299642 RepID=A0A8X6PUH5_NEPPI|nr:hypothetical protein NPIL_153761 [Nephila pilipes]
MSSTGLEFAHIHQVSFETAGGESGIFQANLEPQFPKYTAFITHGGQHGFLIFPFVATKELSKSYGLYIIIAIKPSVQYKVKKIEKHDGIDKRSSAVDHIKRWSNSL